MLMRQSEVKPVTGVVQLNCDGFDIITMAVTKVEIIEFEGNNFGFPITRRSISKRETLHPLLGDCYSEIEFTRILKSGERVAAWEFEGTVVRSIGFGLRSELWGGHYPTSPESSSW